jgi:hypothetical protein
MGAPNVSWNMRPADVFRRLGPYPGGAPLYAGPGRFRDTRQGLGTVSGCKEAYERD